MAKDHVKVRNAWLKTGFDWFQNNNEGEVEAAYLRRGGGNY